MSKIPVSVCIIAKNEEKYIDECLKRLEPYGFEIVVTDTGSTDQTVEIAKNIRTKCLRLNGSMTLAPPETFVCHTRQTTGFLHWIVMSMCTALMYPHCAGSCRSIRARLVRFK